MDRLWTPWRFEYVTGATRKSVWTLSKKLTTYVLGKHAFVGRHQERLRTNAELVTVVAFSQTDDRPPVTPVRAEQHHIAAIVLDHSGVVHRFDRKRNVVLAENWIVRVASDEGLHRGFSSPVRSHHGLSPSCGLLRISADQLPIHLLVPGSHDRCTEPRFHIGAARTRIDFRQPLNHLGGLIDRIN